MFRTLASLVAALLPAAALAAGGHDAVGCNGCHSMHAVKGDFAFAVAPNTKATDPKTKATFAGTTALCLGCHSDADKGGQGFAPVSRHISHPFGLSAVNPKVAKVPPETLREGGRFECLGCHDPHPSNPYYKYLRVDTGSKGQEIDKFCAVCHAMKADQAVAAQRAALFSSMDEQGSRVLAPPKGEGGAAPASKPAKKGKK